MWSQFQFEMVYDYNYIYVSNAKLKYKNFVNLLLVWAWTARACAKLSLFNSPGIQPIVLAGSQTHALI